MALGVLALLLLPALVAYLIGRRTELPARRWFAFISTVFAYGAIGLAGIPIVLFEILATFVAPQWHADGHKELANAVYWTSQNMGWIPLMVGFVASFAIPIWLRKTWAAVFSAHCSRHTSAQFQHK